jgi:hypothetical protein
VKLSDLVARCQGDPELMIEDENGIPQPVVDTDLGVMVSALGTVMYVLLEPERGGDQ